MNSYQSIALITYVWPESRSSAAGFRNLNLIDFFREQDWEVHCLSAASLNEFSDELKERGVQPHSIKLNCDSFDNLLTKIAPTMVIFDRFVTEEQYGWRVEKCLPQTLRVLDTQDLHFLRKQRELLVSTKKSCDTIQSEKQLIMDTKDSNNKFQDEELRELSSIYRCDLSLIISSYEMELLETKYEIPSKLIHHFPFCYEEPKPTLPFEERKHFCFIGNFRHTPNLDGIRWFIQNCWSDIRHAIGSVELHLYGAYPSKEVTGWTNPKLGIRFCGSPENQFEKLSMYRASVAPLRFGAGLKGKITDSWLVGTPVLSTVIGAEGMQNENNSWGGLIVNSPSEFLNASLKLYEDRNTWQESQSIGYEILNTQFERGKIFKELGTRINELLQCREHERGKNLIGSLLRHNQHRSMEYFGRWLTEKDRNKSVSKQVNKKHP